MRPVSAVSTGAPMATPTAYRLTSRPAEGRETARSAAMVGSKPTMTNSVVPIAKADKVRAQRASGMVHPQRKTRLQCARAGHRETALRGQVTFDFNAQMRVIATRTAIAKCYHRADFAFQSINQSLNH